MTSNSRLLRARILPQGIIRKYPAYHPFAHEAPYMTTQPVDTIFTIGHSTRTFAEFAALLQQAGVTLLVDVRSIPRSRTTPQFNKDVLPASLAADGMRYDHLPALGGRRHHRKGAPPLAQHLLACQCLPELR